MQSFQGNTWYLNYDDVFQEINQNTNLFSNIPKETPGLFEEIKGMAYASNANLAELWLLNCLDEIMSYCYQKKGMDKCTCISIKRKDNNVVYAAQNLLL